MRNAQSFTGSSRNLWAVKATTYRRTNSPQRLKQLKHSGLFSQRRLGAIDLARRLGLFDPGRRSGLLVGGAGPRRSSYAVGW
jgi:hypothetical protein